MNPQSSSLKDLIVALLLLVGIASAIRTVNPTIARDDNPTSWTLQQWQLGEIRKLRSFLPQFPSRAAVNIS